MIKLKSWIYDNTLYSYIYGEKATLSSLDELASTASKFRIIKLCEDFCSFAKRNSKNEHTS